MSDWLGWRPLARVALREVTRRKGRTALVSLLIALPMAMLTFMSVMVRTNDLDPERSAQVRLGPLVDLRLTGPPAGPGGDLAPPPLPANARTAAVTVRWGARISRGSERLRAGVLEADWTNPLLAHTFVLGEGRWPSVPGEVAVSSGLARRAGWRVGAAVTLTRPALEQRVVGVFEQRDALGEQALATAPGSSLGLAESHRRLFVDLGEAPGPEAVASVARRARGAGLGGVGWHVDGPEGFDEAAAARFRTNQRQALAALQAITVVGLFLLGLIVTAAFAVGARRQLRTLGLISANGADPRQVGRAVTLQGTLNALVGAALGVALGVAALVATAPHWNRWAGQILPGVQWSALDWIIGGALAVAAGTVAAFLPARTARRAPILSALAGRRPLPPVTAGLPVKGAATAAVGLALVFYATGAEVAGDAWYLAALGGSLVVLGGVLCAPYLVSLLEPLAGRVEQAGRLAARRIARNRSRSGPVVGAIMATAAAAIAVSSMTSSMQRGEAARYVPTMPADQVVIRTAADDPTNDGPTNTAGVVRDQVLAIVAGAKVASFLEYGAWSDGDAAVFPRLAAAGGEQRAELMLLGGGADLLEVLGAPPDVVGAFAGGRPIALVDEAEPSYEIELVANSGAAAMVGGGWRVEEAPGSPAETAPVETLRSRLRIEPYPWAARPVGRTGTSTLCDHGGCRRLPGVSLLLPPAAAAELGLRSGAPATLVQAPEALTAAQREALTALGEDLEDLAPLGQGSAGAAWLTFETPQPRPSTLLEVILGGVALVLALCVTAASLALTAVDNAGDDATLVALGASPAVRRRVRAWEAFGLTTLGVCLAVPVGFLPAVAVRSQRDSGDPISFPWLTVLVLVAAAPAAAWAAGWLSARTGRRVELGVEA